MNKDLLIKNSIHYLNFCEMIRKVGLNFCNDYNKKLLKGDVLSLKLCDKYNTEIIAYPNLKHHMTLVLIKPNGSKSANDEKGVAIYFEREGKASSFCPFLVIDPEDIHKLKKLFNQMWNEAMKKLLESLEFMEDADYLIKYF